MVTRRMFRHHMLLTAARTLRSALACSRRGSGTGPDDASACIPTMCVCAAEFWCAGLMNCTWVRRKAASPTSAAAVSTHLADIVTDLLPEIASHDARAHDQKPESNDRVPTCEVNGQHYQHQGKFSLRTRVTSRGVA
eukprot:499812-Pyramimonas_sp.AAC.1